MSKATKPTMTAEANGNELPFEEALKKLETIVAAMEGGDLQLETMVVRYEEGMRLAQTCQARLAEAEIKIQQLENEAAGSLSLKPMAAPPTSSSM